MKDRLVLAFALALVALTALVAAAIDIVRHQRLDVTASGIAVAAVLGAAWVYSRSLAS